MGKGLQRIAALTATATAAVMAMGAIEVGALVGVSTPTVTTTAPQTTVTVPSTTVTVPRTPVTPTTTVTTPTVKTPPPPAPPKVTTPKVTPPKVTTPKVSVPKVGTPKVEAPTSGTSGRVEKTVDEVVSGVTSGGDGGGASGGGGSAGGGGSPTKTVDDLLSTGTSALGSAGGGGGATSVSGADSGNTALQALGFFGGPAGPGGTAGAGGGGGSQGVFAAGGRGGSLPPKLTAAQAKQLRAALKLLEGCMSAIAPLDRQVLGMRAGTGDAPPLSRRQVASRLGVAVRQVRVSEQRGLSGLREAAARTSCAGSQAGPFAVAGIAATPLLALFGRDGGPGAGGPGATGGSGGGYIAAREAGPGAESPLARLADGGESGPAWLIVLVTVLFSVAVAALMRELRTSLGAPRY